MTMDWRGDRVRERARAAQKEGINQTMAKSVEHAARHHPWTYRTGTLEGSLRIVNYATEGQRGVSGLWGSTDVLYAIMLELGTARMQPFPYLRPAADAEYPHLAQRIAAAYRRSR